MLSVLRSSLQPAFRDAAARQVAEPAGPPKPITAVEVEQLRPGGSATAGTTGVQAPSFDHMLGNMVQEVNAKQLQAGEAVRGLLGGENVPLHRVMIAAEEASVSFQLMVEVRNKLLESYQELMRMQV
ncbi:MAG: flagellar hook-basal body complex protein FliE [Verrucomicrobiales bacterium]|nr:flagellar hook-basal body complex protein FliE [Verrucomicrobiales bacterium]